VNESQEVWYSSTLAPFAWAAQRPRLKWAHCQSCRDWSSSMGSQNKGYFDGGHISSDCLCFWKIFRGQGLIHWQFSFASNKRKTSANSGRTSPWVRRGVSRSCPRRPCPRRTSKNIDPAEGDGHLSFWVGIHLGHRGICMHLSPCEHVWTSLNYPIRTFWGCAVKWGITWNNME
jgi:hypothetical protein